MRLTLVDRKNLGSDLYLFSFEPGEPLSWKGGQHMVFTLRHERPDSLGPRRTFSIASAPFEKKVMVLTRCADRASTFKRALRTLREGDSIEGDGPAGDFVITNYDKAHTLIAAGVGIAPYRSMLLDLDYRNLPLKATLMYSHTSGQFPFKDEFEKLSDRHERFKVVYTVDPGGTERGRIKEMLLGLEDHPFYMSGVYIRKIAAMLE